jgi:hypothetical protein
MSARASMKRKRQVVREGLQAGERLKRSKLASSNHIWTSPWGWVGTEVLDSSSILDEHLKATCGFLSGSGHSFCGNRFNKQLKEHLSQSGNGVTPEEQDVIVVSDEDVTACNKRLCRKNPNCLNHLGQDRWVGYGE